MRGLTTLFLCLQKSIGIKVSFDYSESSLFFLFYRATFLNLIIERLKGHENKIYHNSAH